MVLFDDTSPSDTFRLFPKASFVKGFGGALELTCAMNLYRAEPLYCVPIGNEADIRAIRSGWKAIGRDFRQSTSTTNR
jgi:hypothetical protein